MRTKWLISVMSILLVLGLSVPVLAEWYDDPTGDYLGDPCCDLKRAKLLIYNTPGKSVGHQGQPKLPDTIDIKLFIEMVETCSLPGLVILEIDVDNKPGPASILGNIVMPPPLPVKTCDGFDIAIFQYLRDQADTSEGAYCKSCLGPQGRCMIRGDACAGPCTFFGPKTCYNVISSCIPGQTDCYYIGATQCDCPPEQGFCYLCPERCTLETDCYRYQGLRAGEYYVTANRDSAAIPLYRGNIDQPKPYETGSTWKDHYHYCLSNIVEAVNEFLAEEHPDDVITEIAQFPQWQVSVWKDEVFADGDDFRDKLPDFLHIRD